MKQSIKTLLFSLLVTGMSYGQSQVANLTMPVPANFDNLASTLLDRIEFEQTLLDTLAAWDCPQEYQLAIAGLLAPSKDQLLLTRADALQHCFGNDPQKLKVHLQASLSELLELAGLQSVDPEFWDACLDQYLQWLPPLARETPRA